MSASPPFLVEYPALAAYVAAVEGAADLQPVIRGLPPEMPVIWLDSARRHPVTGRYSLLACDPWLRLVSHGAQTELRTSRRRQVTAGDPLRALERALIQYAMPLGGPPYARALGLFGWLSYDLNRWIERLPTPQEEGGGTPEMGWFGMRLTVLVDHLLQRSWVVSVIDPHQPPVAARREACNRMGLALAWLDGARHAVAPCAQLSTQHGRMALTPTTSQPQFEEMVARALDAIRAGEIFQANLSQRMTSPWHGSIQTLYQALRDINPSPFMALLSVDGLAVASASPERLIRMEDGWVETRPIAGTRPRGRDVQEEAVNSLELLLSEKERAEHIMLVDLERNDLGRICRSGSVVVDELMGLESYSHVIHIVSNVSGALRPGVRPVDAIRAVFPGGTITGCPKVRCMQLLRELEPVARGLYTGSLGYISFDGAMDLNIAIRTLVAREGVLSFHAGAGIVADSIAEREYHETLAKGQALLEAVRKVSEGLGGVAQGSGLGAVGSYPEPRARSPQPHIDGIGH